MKSGWRRVGRGRRIAHPGPVLLAALALTLALGARPALAQTARPVAPAGLSVIEAPVHIPLAPLFAEVERLTPRETGHWRTWKEVQGVDTRYRAWRGPVSFRMAGQTLLATAHVRYWVRARARLLGAIELNAGCGVDEPPRQAVIGVAARLEWAPDWTLQPRFRVLPTRFIDRCEMTAADLDVTPLIGPVFEQALRVAIAEALGTQRQALAEFRSQAARAWERLAQPLELGPDLWLQLRPFAVAMAPPEGRRDEVVVRLGVALRPELVQGERPRLAPTPLPPLGRLPAGRRGLAFNIDLALDWETAGDRLTEALQGRRFEIGGRDLEIRRIRLSGGDSEIVAHVDLGGTAGGDLELWARPVIVPGSAPLQLEDLEYLYHPDDPLVGLAAESLYEKVRGMLLEAANRTLETRLDEAAARIRGALESALPPGIEVSMDGLRLEAGSIRVRETGLVLEGTAAGGLELRVHPAGATRSADRSPGASIAAAGGP
ncbi:MAG: DUF4403 family protein [Chromatiales bacterium]